jgi:hypothetical protein
MHSNVVIKYKNLFKNTEYKEFYVAWILSRINIKFITVSY